ncbi:hypothetical protein IAU60_006003 [Kwoniella sp. DSM 27419]
MYSAPGPSRPTAFLPLPPRDIRSPTPTYRAPTLITTYSHQPDRNIHHDDSSMAYYRPAPTGCDLNHGFERRIERDESVNEHLDGLCEALRRVSRQGGQAERRGGIITWRGMITRMMTAPFEHREGWEMDAVALDGSVYVEQHEGPGDKAKWQNDVHAARQTYMGYSFESFSTIPGDSDASDEQEQGWGGDVNTNVQWCNVVRTAVGDIPLCLGGEVDCVRAEPGSAHPGLEHCVELKTNKVIQNEKQEAVFHRKLLKHWAQSWLLGIPEIQVGFRDDAGILQSQRGFRTERIPRLIASLPYPPWDPHTPLHFLHALVTLICDHILPTDPCLALAGAVVAPDQPLPPAQVWRIRYVPKSGCELYQLGSVGNVEGRWGGMLKEDYVRWRMGAGAV